MNIRTAFRAGARAALVLTFLDAGHAAIAGPAEYVYSPLVEEGEKEIDFKAGTAKARDGTRASAFSVGLGLGVNRWWFTELYAIWHKPPGERVGFDAFEWENRFQLVETGKYPVDVGVLLEIERPKDRSEGYEIRWGPLLQADLTPSVQANLNLLFERHVRASASGRTELGYQWQLKYRWRPEFEFGLQGFGDVGPWDHWERRSEQAHRAGPALFGRFRVGDHQVVKYNVGLIFGFTDGAARHTLRAQAEYEF